MTATEELRRMLDERVVKWWPMHDVENCYHQDRDTEFVIDGKKYTAHEWGGTLNVYGFIPEQVIAATLGGGTCHKLPASGEKTCIVRHNSTLLTMEFGYWKCSKCGCECFEGARYCMNCGAKVVDA